MYAFIKQLIEKEILTFSVLTVSFLILTVLVKSVVLPSWQKNAPVRKEVSRYRALIIGSNEYNTLKEDIREKQKLLEEKHTSLTKGMADPHDLSGLLQMIFDKAWESGIKFDKTIPQEETKKEDYIHYPLVLETITDYNSLGKFISLLEKIPQIVHVDRIAITANEKNKIQTRILITCFLGLKE